MTETATTRTRVLAAAARSDRGRVRSNNEDVPLLDAERGVFGVIDGVGGQAAGELAASIARDVIMQRLARPLGAPAERVREAIAIANNEIFRRATTSPDLAGMTCVVTLALVHDGTLTIGHVGDTRLYKIGPDGLHKLTHDHSPVGEREDAQEIAEVDAMRHPRRHEVFRDVGSALRDKDEDDYVEVIEDTLADDGAILACSDGLTDMIPSEAVERIVRAHAGDPQAVVDALVAAANEAGGRDNVTAVYAEGPEFAGAVRGQARRDGERRPSLVGHMARAVVASRTTWFAVGLVAGALSAFLFMWRAADAPPVGGRTIPAAPTATETVGTLAAAIASARSGDVIRLEPGTYAERVVVPPGVSLAARVPGSVTFVPARGAAAGVVSVTGPDGTAGAPPDTGGDWVAITATGDAGGAITGIRIASTPGQPMAVGIRLTGYGRSVELVEIDGPMRTGLELADASSASLRGSRFTVTGAPVTVGAASRFEGVGNVFVHNPAEAGSHVPSKAGSHVPGNAGSHVPGKAGSPVPLGTTAARSGSRSARKPTAPTSPPTPALTLADGAEVILRQNVFAGFGPDPVRGLAPGAREPLRAANVVLAADPSSLR